MEGKQDERIIVLVDMDCFYVQVEQKLCPEYFNKPCAVVQYNTWKGGGIIAVNYEARARGVSKSGRGLKAMEICPDLHLFRVPEVRGKADLTRYREAGAKVMEVLCKFSDCVERASIDEAYIDLTTVVLAKLQNSCVTIDQIPNTFVVGYENGDDQKDALKDWLKSIYEEDHLHHDQMLAVAASIVEEMRAAVYSETGYRCSAGIAHNKMLAKLSCGLHKPNKQTVIPQSSIPILYETLPISKVRNLGGKFGKLVSEKFGVTTMGDLLKLPKSRFVNAFGEKDGSWLYGLSRGVDTEAVTARQLPKSIGCGKNFRGKSCLNTKEKVSHWIKQLASELEERLIKDQESNSRMAQLLTISLRIERTVVSRSCPILIYNAEKIAHDTYSTIQKFNSSAPSSPDWSPAILSLAMSAGKFEDKIDNTHDILTYFTKSPVKKNISEASTSASNIDTIIGLIDSEADQTDITTPKEASSTKKDEGIAQFFKSKNSECGKANQTTVTTCSDLTKTDDLEIGTSISIKMDYNALKDFKDKTECNDTNNSFANGGKKEKGFFARKLEEKMKSLNERKNASSSTNEETCGTNGLNATSFASCSNTASTSSTSFQNGTEITNGINSLSCTTFNETNGAVKNGTSLASCSNSESTSSLSFQNEAEMTDVSDCINVESDYSNLDPALTYECTKCNQRIPIWEEEEHLDYHLALDLSKEPIPAKVTLIDKNNRSVQTRNPGKTSKSTKGKKRGTYSNSTASKRAVQKNTLDSFFR